ncbi:MAG: hypothetical protein AAGA42_08725, partial [Actinomycetota bacterium]
MITTDSSREHTPSRRWFILTPLVLLAIVALVVGGYGLRPGGSPASGEETVDSLAPADERRRQPIVDAPRGPYEPATRSDLEPVVPDAPASWVAAVESGNMAQIRSWYMANTGHDADGACPDESTFKTIG